MKQDISTTLPDDPANTQDNVKPDWVLVLILRVASASIAYGMCHLFAWIDSLSDEYPILMVTTVVIGILFFLLGVIMPGKVVIKTWKIISKGALLLLYFI